LKMQPKTVQTYEALHTIIRSDRSPPAQVQLSSKARASLTTTASTVASSPAWIGPRSYRAWASLPLPNQRRARFAPALSSNSFAGWLAAISFAHLKATSAAATSPGQTRSKNLSPHPMQFGKKPALSRSFNVHELAVDDRQSGL
jgi:hypothetical protein